LVVNVIDGVEMVDVRRAAQLVRRTPETVRRWIWSGRLPAVRRGNRLMVARQALDLDDLTSSRATTAGPELALRAWAALAADECRAADRRPSVGKSAAELVLAGRRDRTDDHGPTAGG